MLKFTISAVEIHHFSCVNALVFRMSFILIPCTCKMFLFDDLGDVVIDLYQLKVYIPMIGIVIVNILRA